MISRSDLPAEVRALMTPQERAEKIINDSLAMSQQTNEQLAELIRVAIVEATNDELEKRRAAEAEAARLEGALREVNILAGVIIRRNQGGYLGDREDTRTIARVSLAALASTDARAWLNTQKAAELLRCADELQEPGKFESKEVQYLRKRAAALLQQEARDGE